MYGCAVGGMLKLDLPMEEKGDATPTAGWLVTPSLRLVREIGHGGMGNVWMADHLALKTQVAVKFLSERSESMPDAVERFSKEATAAATIKSQHVVQVFDHGFSNGKPYIVMELLEGEDLGQRLSREKRLPAADVLQIVRQAAKALERAHASGIIHRDIKPANVFLVSGQDELFVKLLDFGLAKHSTELSDVMTGSHVVFGTPHYLSPEQAERARAATPKSDLWSLAVVAYECLTGHRPFTSDSLMGLCIALHEARFERATLVCPDLPSSIDAWFLRAFQPAPEDRFASASELVSSLATALAATEPRTTIHGVPAAPASVPALTTTTALGDPKGAQRPRSKRRVAGAFGIAALLGLTAFVGSRLLFGAAADTDRAQSATHVALEPHAVASNAPLIVLGPAVTSLAAPVAAPIASGPPAAPTAARVADKAAVSRPGTVAAPLRSAVAGAPASSNDAPFLTPKY